MNQRIIHLSDYEAFEYLVTGKNIVEVRRLLIHDDHLHNALAQFEHSLQHSPRLPTVLVIDTLQEEYQRGLIPHVMGKDRQQLIQHKMQRLFEYTAFSHAEFQGREIGGRGDDRVLFTALNNPTLVQPWLELLTRHKIPLLGLYSLPLLSQQLLKYLPRAPYTLLIAPTPPINTQTIQGIRQTFFAQQQLQFSRLLPVTAIQNYIDDVMTQINQVQSFLSNSRVLPAGTTLLVVILAFPELIDIIDNFLEKNKLNNMNVETIDIIEFSRYLGLKLPENQIYLQTLTIYEFIRSPVKNHYARKIDLRYAFYRQVQRGIYLTSLIIFLGSAGASALSFIEGFQEGQTVRSIISRKMAQESQLKELRAAKENLPIEIEYIRDIAIIGRYLKAQHLHPQISWVNLSRVLEQCPSLMLERLEWGVASSTAELTKSFTQVAIPNSTTKNQEEESTQPTNLAEKFIEGLRVSGKVESFQGDYLRAELAVKRCFEKFQQDTHFSEVKLLSSPINQISKEALQGDLADSESVTAEAKFIIEVLIEHGAK